MKKLLVLLLVLGMASMAQAGLILTVDGLPAPDEIDLIPSDYITLDVSVEADTLLAGGDLMITLSNAQGVLDASGIVFEQEPLTLAYNPFAGGWIEFNLPWDGPWATVDAQPQQVLISGGNLSFDTMGPYTLMDGLVFHCEEPTDVVIELVAFNRVTYYDHDTSVPPGDSVAKVLYAKDTIIDSIIVHQIPEPMTMSLLGLGGLALLRRRRA